MSLEKGEHVWKKKTDVLPLESIELYKDYALTINPCDSFQFFGVPFRERSFYESLLNDFLSPMLSHILFMEVSPKGRLHWHGTLQFQETKEIIKYYTHQLPAWLARSTVVLKEIDSSDKWFEYCRKQKTFHEYLKENGEHHNSHYTGGPCPEGFTDEYKLNNYMTFMKGVCWDRSKDLPKERRRRAARKR